MALLKTNDRVKETASFSGTTSPITLLGAATNFLAFTTVLANGASTYYCIEDTTNNQWEIGIGIFTTSGTTLTRATILASSNSNSIVSFTAGTKNVFMTAPAHLYNGIASGVNVQNAINFY